MSIYKLTEIGRENENLEIQQQLPVPHKGPKSAKMVKFGGIHQVLTN